MFPHYKYVNLDSDYLDVFSGELLEELKAEGKEVTEKDNIYNHWLDSSSPSSCAYWALSKPLGSEGYDRHLEHYAFCKDDQIDLENYTLSENEVIFVCGEEYIDLGFDDEEDDEDAHYLPQWEKFTSIEEAKEFKKTLCQDRRMMVFSIKNDILPEAIKKKEERDEAYRKYQQRKNSSIFELTYQDLDYKYEVGLNPYSFGCAISYKKFPNFRSCFLCNRYKYYRPLLCS